jgi:predicted DNA-binding transcriptional regulator AlpA
MQIVQFISTTPQELQQQINEGVKIQLQDFLKHFTPTQPKTYLTRTDVATMLSIDLSTVHNMCKSKRLNPLSLGGSRVYFLRSEVEASLRPINV